MPNQASSTNMVFFTMSCGSVFVTPAPAKTFKIGDVVRYNDTPHIGRIVSRSAIAKGYYNVQPLDGKPTWIAMACELSLVDGSYSPAARRPSPGNVRYSQPLPLP